MTEEKKYTPSKQAIVDSYVARGLSFHRKPTPNEKTALIVKYREEILRGLKELESGE